MRRGEETTRGTEVHRTSTAAEQRLGEQDHLVATQDRRDEEGERTIDQQRTGIGQLQERIRTVEEQSQGIETESQETNKSSGRYATVGLSENVVDDSSIRSFRLRAENERLKNENVALRSDLTQTKQAKDEIIGKNNELITQLENDVEQKSKEIQKLEEQLRGDLSTQDRSSLRMKQLEEELTAERQQRQRLVIEMHRLEQKCENLQSELQNGNGVKIKSAPSDSNMTWDSKFMDTLDLDDLPVSFARFLQ